MVGHMSTCKLSDPLGQRVDYRIVVSKKSSLYEIIADFEVDLTLNEPHLLIFDEIHYKNS